MMQMQETAYKKISELDYNLVGFSGQRADSYSGNSAGMGGMNSISQSNLTGQEVQGIKQLLFGTDTGHFHDSWSQGFYFDKKMQYGIF